MNELTRITYPSDDLPVFTAGEFMRMIEIGAFDGARVELVAGEIRKVMPAGLAHGEANFTIATKLAEAFQSRSIRIAIDLAIANDGYTVRGADVAIVHPTAPARGAIEGKDAILLVEIADTTLAKDLGDKTAEYAAAGVADYWVVDLNARAVHTMSGPIDDSYASRAVYRFGEPIPVPGADTHVVID